VILVQRRAKDFDLNSKDFETQRSKQTNYCMVALARGDPPARRSSPDNCFKIPQIFSLETQSRTSYVFRSQIDVQWRYFFVFRCSSRNKSRSARRGEVVRWRILTGHAKRT
jgi:hypothetical protein